MKRKALKAAFPCTIPIMTGYLSLGVAFGVLLASRGYGLIWAALMSLTVYAGSMQFVAINILIGPFSLIQAVILTLTVNARHLFYGLSMIDKYKDMGKRKAYMIFSLTDETYSLICGIAPPEGVDKNWFYFFIAMLDQLYWIAGSALGSAAGSLLKFNTTGIDFAMTALFVVIFVEQWEHTKNHVPAIAGIVLTLAALLLFGAQDFIIISMAAILVFLSLSGRQAMRRADDDSTGDH